MTGISTDSRIKVEQPDKGRLDEVGVESWPIWTKEPSTFDWHYDSTETCYFLEGEVIVQTDKGEVAVGKGDLVTFEKGLNCRWQVNLAVRKHYRFE